MEFDQEYARRIASLEARMNRMETMMQELLSILTSSSAQVQQMTHMQNMLQELRGGQNNYMRSTSGPDPLAISQQERPEIRAIREALLCGDKIKAIQLYRSVYGVGLKEAQVAIDAM